MAINTIGGSGIGRRTATAGTAIVALLPPSLYYFTRLLAARYTAAGTAHVLTAMVPIGRTTAASAGATGQAVLNLTEQPTSGNNVAGSDYLAWDNGDGTYSFDIVSSVSSLAITMTSNLPKAVAAGQTVWHFGVIGDTVPLTGRAHEAFSGTASTTSTYEHANGILCTPRQFDPILLHSGNGTAAGVLEYAVYAYTDKGWR